MRDTVILVVVSSLYISFQKKGAITSTAIKKYTEMSISLISVFSYKFLMKSAMSARKLRSTGTKT